MHETSRPSLSPSLVFLTSQRANSSMAFWMSILIQYLLQIFMVTCMRTQRNGKKRTQNVMLFVNLSSEYLIVQSLWHLKNLLKWTTEKRINDGGKEIFCDWERSLLSLEFKVRFNGISRHQQNINFYFRDTY